MHYVCVSIGWVKRNTRKCQRITFSLLCCSVYLKDRLVAALSHFRALLVSVEWIWVSDQSDAPHKIKSHNHQGWSWLRRNFLRTTAKHHLSPRATFAKNTFHTVVVVYLRHLPRKNNTTLLCTLVLKRRLPKKSNKAVGSSASNLPLGKDLVCPAEIEWLKWLVWSNK